MTEYATPKQKANSDIDSLPSHLKHQPRMLLQGNRSTPSPLSARLLGRILPLKDESICRTLRAGFVSACLPSHFPTMESRPRSSDAGKISHPAGFVSACLPSHFPTIESRPRSSER